MPIQPIIIIHPGLGLLDLSGGILRSAKHSASTQESQSAAYTSLVIHCASHCAPSVRRRASRPV